MTLLITGFEPFGGHEYNPSAMAVESLQSLAGAECRILPVNSQAGDIYWKMLESIRPEFIVNIGLNQNTPMILLEKTALNIIDYQGHEDNDGNIIGCTGISSEGPDGFISTINQDALKKSLLEKGIPASVSFHAGTFLCNMVYYTSFMYFYRQKRDHKCIFVHIPFDTEYVSGLMLEKDQRLCHMPKAMILNAVRIISDFICLIT